MMQPHDFDYAMENTRVILAPRNAIQTFGHTVFHFHLISEMMDSVNQIRVRDGKIHAERPEIVSPQTFSKLLLEGFGERAETFADEIQEHLGQIAILKYGFRVRKTDVVEDIVHDPVEAVIDRVKAQVTLDREPMSAIIHGVDEGWEICLVKFTMDMIQRSSGGNMTDFRNRGLL